MAVRMPDADEDNDATWSLIVQLPISGFWGTDDENDIRREIGEAMEVRFRQTGLGNFDGSDCGSGTINFFTFRIRPDDWDRAFDLWLTELRRRKLAERAIVVRSVAADEDDDDREYTVVWPPDFEGHFRLGPAGQ